VTKIALSYCIHLVLLAASPKVTGSIFFRVKVAGTWSWPLTSVHCRG